MSKKTENHDLSDQQLDTFLRENRPKGPASPDGESERIWAEISRLESHNKVFSWRYSLGAFTLMSFMVFGLWTQNRSPSESLSTGMDELSEVVMMSESLDDEFMSDEDIYEVNDLVALAE